MAVKGGTHSRMVDEWCFYQEPDGRCRVAKPEAETSE